MVVGRVSGALGSSSSKSVNAQSAAGTTNGCNDRAATDSAAVERMLDSGSVGEAVEWVDSLLGRSERRVGTLGSEQEARRLVAVKLKRLATLKRAVETLETTLRRHQLGFALELAPGLSDHFWDGQQCRDGEQRRFPLSYAQQQMLALQQMHPDSATYNVTRAVRVADGVPLDLEALSASVRLLLAKHETLRTLFAPDPLGCDPQQSVLPLDHYRVRADADESSTHPLTRSILRVVDWTGPTEAYDDDEAVGAFITAHSVSAPFDLAHELPVRIAAIRAVAPDNGGPSARAGEVRWTLVAVLHHIATDGASSAIFWRDLFELYASSLAPAIFDADRAVDTVTTERRVVRYRDYAVWQRERVQSGALDASIAYWSRQFDATDGDSFSPVPILELPFDKKPTRSSNSPIHLSRGDIVTFRPSDAAFARMTALCQSHGCSLYIGLLAVFYIMLSRLSGGATDITIGTPVSARDREELQQVMGYFVNTLPLRIRSRGIRSSTGSSAGATDDEDTFAILLQAVREVVLGAFAHMEVPFHEMLERIRASARHRQQMQHGDNNVKDEGDGDGSQLHALYSVMFALEQNDNKLDASEYGRELQLPHASAKFDLMLTMRVVNQRQNGGMTTMLEGEMEFPLDKFRRSSVERFGRYYCELLEQVTLLPEASLSNVSMLPKSEQQRLVKSWGALRQSQTPSRPSDLPIGAFASTFIDECLRQQVQLTPMNWALHFDDGESWSYEALWRESSRVFNALIDISTSRSANCIDREEGDWQLRVGLFLPRGLANAAAIVGAMRARAIFVPLDASFPRERLRYMIRDAAVHAIVTQRSHAEGVSELLEGGSTEVHGGCEPIGDLSNVTVVTWEDLPPGDDEGAQVNQSPPSNPDDDAPAYILYTSGSTGAPKGVVVSHGNLLTTLRWTIRAYDVTSSDVFLQSTSATLDGSLTQLLSPLLAGGAAVITRDGGLHDLDYIRSLLSAPPPRAITYCVLVPSYLSTLLDYHHPSGCSGVFCFPPTVRHVVVVGEAFPMELARKFYRLLLNGSGNLGEHGMPPTTCLVNEYGPTEAAVTSTFFRLPLASVFPSSNDDGDKSVTSISQTDTVPIGVPIDGRRALVLDVRGRLVPPNVCGELFLGGAGVSCGGYWRRPDLTKAAFDHPELSKMLQSLSGEDERRWYKTGDVVKWLPDGNLVFVGRVDSQVKLRGQRVELNEVRNVLLHHGSVVDAEIWRQVLDLDTDRMSDSAAASPWMAQSFFALGGDSLTAIRAISLARARGIALTLDAFFTSSSVADMAARAPSSTGMLPLTSQSLVPLNVDVSRDLATPLTLFLIHGADGTVWKLLELASLLPFRVVGVQSTGTSVTDSVEALAARYWAEIQAVQPHGPYALGGFSFGCRVAHEVARIASRAGHQLYPLTLVDGVPFYTDDNYGQDVDVEAYILESFGGRRPRGEEAEFFDQLASRFRAHCAMEDAYRPLGRIGESAVTSKLSAVVYKTDKWDVDAAAMRLGGVDVQSVAFSGSTHLSLLQRPQVTEVARAIREQLKA